MASSDSPQPILVLYSHGRSPPLHPTPDLKYDIRNIPNPPKQLRDISDGRSKRLREHLLAQEKFVQKLSVVEDEIRTAMETRLIEWEKTQKGKSDSVDPTDSQAVEKTDGENCEAVTKTSGQEGKQKDEDEDTDEEDDEEISDLGFVAENAVVLRVGCNCALGHHRSVAFVCELASRPWPKTWHVEVVHRDLEKKRSGGRREAQKAGWKGGRKRDWRIKGEERGLDWEGD